jgi:hypothetical protein
MRRVVILSLLAMVGCAESRPAAPRPDGGPALELPEGAAPPVCEVGRDYCEDGWEATCHPDLVQPDDSFASPGCGFVDDPDGPGRGPNCATPRGIVAHPLAWFCLPP